MVEAMGTFREFGEFKKICCKAFQIIRKKCSNLILNSLLAMTKCKYFKIHFQVDVKRVNVSGNDPSEALHHLYIYKHVRENLKLDLSDKDAEEHLLKVIDLSLKSVLPKITEKFHRLSQTLKI
jgi:hypothetical protein